WLKDGLALVGANSPSLVLSNLHAGDAGNYLLVASNNDGGVVTRLVQLTVRQRTAPRLGIRNAPGVELQLSGTVGNSYRIEYSPNLGPAAIWQPLQTISALSSTSITVRDSNVGNSRRRFYRALLLP